MEKVFSYCYLDHKAEICVGPFRPKERPGSPRDEFFVLQLFLQILAKIKPQRATTTTTVALFHPKRGGVVVFNRCLIND